MHHTFLYISFPFLHDHDVKMPNFEFYGAFFLELDLWSPEIHLQEGSPTMVYNWQSKWVGIIAVKTETQVHFLSDVLVAVASLDLKVPNRRDTRLQDKANISLLISSPHTVNGPSCHARHNILDSTLWVLNSRYWSPDSLAVELWFRIPGASYWRDSGLPYIAEEIAGRTRLCGL